MLVQGQLCLSVPLGCLRQLGQLRQLTQRQLGQLGQLGQMGPMGQLGELGQGGQKSAGKDNTVGFGEAADTQF